MEMWLLSILVWLAGFQNTGQRWPQLQHVSARFPVDLNAEKILIDLPLRDLIGTVVYHFACRGGSLAYLDSLPREEWVGPLACGLAEGSEAQAGGLLGEDGAPPWHTRARFDDDDLVGDCARYPEFGVHRTFRLRGFRMILDARDVHLDARGRPQSFVLVVLVTPDSGAKLPYAERPDFLRPHGPGRSCSIVRRGRDPRMCRNEQGSWEECK